MTVRALILAGLTGLSLSACATSEPVCRPADLSERSLFGALVAHDEDRLADLMAAGAGADAIRRLDPEIQARVFGARMGDPAVRTVMMQPPLCIVDGAPSNGVRISHVFPQARFDALQNPDIEGLERGRSGIDHAACRFVEVEGQWRLSDACMATFSRPAS